MSKDIQPTISKLIGETPLLRVTSLSKATGCEILLKCENLNPGGSIKDRAALGMVNDALQKGALKPGMTIVEGTAGNTGIGLALVGRSHGISSLIVMPSNQSPQKMATLNSYGAELKLVAPCAFADQNHFYHTARRIAESDRAKYWWANQFENLANSRCHFETTGPEIWRQTAGKIDALVSAAGTGGTISGVSKYLKAQNPKVRVVLSDPEGSGLCHFLKSGEFKTNGSSFAEGIGIMRLVANFGEAQIDEAMTVSDSEAVAVAYHVRQHDGIVLGTSAALNLAGCLRVAKSLGSGHTLVTFWCDQADRSAGTLWDLNFLSTKGIDPNAMNIDSLN